MMKSLPYFAFLILVANLHYPALLILTLVLLFRLWYWCADRWPRTTHIITWLFLGMISGGRWRRW